MQVTRVANLPQAADLALKEDVTDFLKGLEDRSHAQEQLVCIISDDRQAMSDSSHRFKRGRRKGSSMKIYFSLQSPV